MRARKQWIDAGLTGRAVSLADGQGITGGTLVNIGGVIKCACHSFARAVDWQHRSRAMPRHGGLQELGTRYKLSENHEGLHSGGFISVSVSRNASALAIKGGYYDRYCQPKTVYEQSVPLREVNAKALVRLLLEMHDRLVRHPRSRSA